MATQRTVLITGCSDGSLGAALAKAFHERKWRVFASARNLNKLKQTEAAGIETIQLDSLSSESIASCVTQIAGRTGGSLDMLVNNAGAGYSMPILDLDIDKARDLFDLNVFSLITMTKAFFPLLQKSSYGGIIANNTSCSSQIVATVPFQGTYNASKAAATSYTEVMRLELAPFGLKVINLMTGSVDSTFHENAPTALLPPDSKYNVAKEEIERTMSGKSAVVGGVDQDDWARGVVTALSKPNPPHWVWGGKHVATVRIGSHLPVGLLDGTMKQMSGLDVVERKIKQARSG